MINVPIEMGYPKEGAVVLIFFKEGLPPCTGWYKKKTKGFLFWKKEVFVFEDTNGWELEQALISHWRYIK